MAALLLFAGDFRWTRQLTELHLPHPYHDLSFLTRMTGLETLEINGEYLSQAPLGPLLGLQSLKKLVIVNESEPLPEATALRLFGRDPEKGDEERREEDALHRLQSLTITSAWMHYHHLALIFRRCRRLKELALSTYLPALDLHGPDPFAHAPPHLERVTLNLPKTLGDNQSQVNLVWAQFLEQAARLPRLKSVSMFERRLTTTWGRARECRLITQQSRYDERGRGLHPAVLLPPLEEEPGNRRLFHQLHLTVRTARDWHLVKKAVRLMARVHTLSLVMVEACPVAPVCAPTRRPIATPIEQLVIEMTVMTKDLTHLLDTFLNVGRLKIVGFLREPPLSWPLTGHEQVATLADVDAAVRRPLTQRLTELEVELTRMSYYETPKEWEDGGGETDGRETGKDGERGEGEKSEDRARAAPEETTFDFGGWSSVTTLTFFYRSGIHPAELRALLAGARNLRRLRLACCHENYADLPAAIVRHLTQLQTHATLAVIHLNYHHLSPRSWSQRVLVKPLSQYLRRLAWSAWRGPLEELVITLIGMRGLKTEAVIVSRNAAGHFQVRHDDNYNDDDNDDDNDDSVRHDQSP